MTIGQFIDELIPLCERCGIEVMFMGFYPRYVTVMFGARGHVEEITDTDLNYSGQLDPVKIFIERIGRAMRIDSKMIYERLDSLYKSGD